MNIENMMTMIQSSGIKRKPIQSADPVYNRPSKILRIISSPPVNEVSDDDESIVKPTKEVNLNEFILSMLSSKGLTIKTQSHDEMRDFFLDPTEEEIKAYSYDVLEAFRNRDLDRIRSFHSEGRPLKCSNKFGESLIHLACRKGMTDVVEFLVNEASVPLSVRDDYGRTPLHDACWAPTPNFRLVSFIISKCPDLLYISDRRGDTPLSYARREHWMEWKTFLRKNSEAILPENIDAFDIKTQ